MRLSDRKPVAAGAKRLVYSHPDDPALLVKVMRPDPSLSRSWGAIKAFDFARRHYFSAVLMRELAEHVRVRYGNRPHPPFMQRLIGFADTDLGLGLVVAAGRRPGGHLAPTLKTLLAKGAVDDQVVRRLERFFDEMTESAVVVGDLHPGNVVYAHDQERGDHFLLIDGIGDKTLVPLLRMSRALRAQAKARKIRHMRAMVERTRRGGPGEGASASRKRDERP